MENTINLSSVLKKSFLEFYGDNSVTLRIERMEDPIFRTFKNGVLCGLHIERLQRHLASNPNRTSQEQEQILELEVLRGTLLDF